jgi:hypothetical protein
MGFRSVGWEVPVLAREDALLKREELLANLELSNLSLAVSSILTEHCLDGLSLMFMMPAYVIPIFNMFTDVQSGNTVM